MSLSSLTHPREWLRHGVYRPVAVAYLGAGGLSAAGLVLLVALTPLGPALQEALIEPVAEQLSRFVSPGPSEAEPVVADVPAPTVEATADATPTPLPEPTPAPTALPAATATPVPEPPVLVDVLPEPTEEPAVIAGGEASILDESPPPAPTDVPLRPTPLPRPTIPAVTPTPDPPEDLDARDRPREDDDDPSPRSEAGPLQGSEQDRPRSEQVPEGPPGLDRVPVAPPSDTPVLPGGDGVPGLPTVPPGRDGDAPNTSEILPVPLPEVPAPVATLVPTSVSVPTQAAPLATVGGVVLTQPTPMPVPPTATSAPATATPLTIPTREIQLPTQVPTLPPGPTTPVVLATSKLPGTTLR